MRKFLAVLALVWLALVWGAEAQAQSAGCPNPNPNLSAWTTTTGPFFQGLDTAPSVNCPLPAGTATTGLNGAFQTFGTAVGTLAPKANPAFTGNASFGGNISVTGTSAFTGAVALSGGGTAGGTFTPTNLTVGGAINLAGSTISGGINSTSVPSIAGTPAGNPVATLYSLNQTSNDVSTATRQYMVNMGFASSNGVGQDTAPFTFAGDRAALFVGMDEKVGSGEVWAINPAVVLEANSSTGHHQVGEMDMNNSLGNADATLGPGGVRFPNSSPSNTTFTGSITTTVLTVTVGPATGFIDLNAVITGAGVAGGTKIVSYGTGTGGAGTYNINNSQSVSNEAMTANNPVYAYGMVMENAGLKSTSAIDIGGSAAFHRGVGCDQTNAADQACFYDYSTSPISLDIWGTHTTGIDFTNATISGNLLQSPGTKLHDASLTLNAPGGTDPRTALGGDANGAVILGSTTGVTVSPFIDFHHQGIASADARLQSTANSSLSLTFASGATGTFVMGGGVMLTNILTASLPSCVAGLKGDAYWVTDANGPTYNATITGGGAVGVIAVCNGSNWTAH